MTENTKQGMTPGRLWNYIWKGGTIILLFYVLIAGLLYDVPRLRILNETIRALHFHVPMWFSMIILFTISMVASIRYLLKTDQRLDATASAFVNTGLVLGTLGLVTGMAWANYTWGEPWSNDPKQLMSLIAMAIYLAYVILRMAIPAGDERARVSAVFNIFAYAVMIPLLFILPRLTDSLHPGNGGNPGFNAYDLDSKLRAVFYPAVIAWTGLGIWISTLSVRLQKVRLQLEDLDA